MNRVLNTAQLYKPSNLIPLRLQTSDLPLEPPKASVQVDETSKYLEKLANLSKQYTYVYLK